MEIQYFLNRTTPILTNYLNDVLPKVCSEWWNECVLNKLSERQKRQFKIDKYESLDDLDLAALLRILIYNWREISFIKNLPIEVKNYANEMLTIRNKFAHLGKSYPDGDYIFRAADTIRLLVVALDENNPLGDEISDFKNTFHPKTMIYSKVEYQKDIPFSESIPNVSNDEPIAKLVRRYIPSILKYCLNNNESELNQLKDKECSNELFGIQYPFLIEVLPNSTKIERYGKPIYSFSNRHFVVTSEWYKRNREKFLSYLKKRNLFELGETPNNVLEISSSAVNRSENIGNISSEIEKIHQRIPKWLKSTNQINHKILVKYLELRGQNEFVYLTELEHQMQSMKTFKANYNQMKIFGHTNHAKVFDEVNGKVYLWNPVKEFILKVFKSIQ